MRRVLYPETVPNHDTNPRGVVGVIGTPDHLEGLAFLIIGTLWYATQHHLEELSVYVEPEYRPKQHIIALINWMKRQSYMTGLRLWSGVMSTERTEAKIRLYKREMPLAGAVFHFDPVTMGSSFSLAVH